MRICFRQSAARRTVSRDIGGEIFIYIIIVAVQMRRIFVHTNGIAEFADTSVICSPPSPSPVALAHVPFAMMHLFPAVSHITASL